MTADVGGSETDAEYAAGFQRDPELFTAVYDKYFRDVYRYVAGRLDNEAADDIAARRKEARHYAALARRAPEPVGYSEENRIVDAVAAGYMRPLLAKALATRGRHQLQQAILRPASRRRAMTGPSRTRRLAAGVGLTAAAAAAAIAALVPGGPLNTAPVRLSARQVLLAAATAAAAQPSSGAYWHVKEVYDFDQPPFGHPRGTWKWTRYTQETWTNRDGAFWVPDSAAGTGVVPLGGPGGFSVASSDLTFNQLQRLPESPAALKAWITHSFKHPAYAQMGIPSASVLPGYVLTTLVRLITDMPVPRRSAPRPSARWPRCPTSRPSAPLTAGRRC